ncbi:MAG: hypothetical protein WCS42_17150, partial [Verrucomicrobiota bacterium]
MKKRVTLLAAVIVALLIIWLCSPTKSPQKISETGNQPTSAFIAKAGATTNVIAAGKILSVSTNVLVTNSLSSLNKVSASTLTSNNGQIKASALKQIGALQSEKLRRTPTQEKIASQLLYADKIRRGIPVAEGVPTQRVNLDRDNQGRVLVDIKAEVTQPLLQRIAVLGGRVISSFPEYRAIQAGVPLSEIENLAAQKEVAFIQPVVHSMNNSVDSEGDYTHQASAARANFGVNGTGVKVGVISDSVDYLSSSQISGLVTVLPGQSGIPDTGEGTAMLEI